MTKVGENFSQYRIISAIGVGGMGEVFLAEDSRLGRKTALKFLAAKFCSERDHLSRFIREARAASALNHPNICTIYEINEDGEYPFIAMEYIEGETLADVIGRRRRNARQALDIAVQITGALAEAHAKGIIHRDIKPANIIISPRGHAKILDFGLAKIVVPDVEVNSKQFLTQAGIILGTASYMSPEQSRGLVVDARTDIWSFGVCLYEMLTGKQLFSGETVSDTIAAILTRDPMPPSNYFADVPVELERIVLKTLRKDKNERYQSADELRVDLRSLRKRLEIEAEYQKSSGTGSISDDQTAVFDTAITEFAVPKVTGEDLKKRNLRSNNLSAFHTPIIGREDQIASISQLLRDKETRLVTMTGIGGTGKTTIARAVAEKMLPDFNDGVFFIELAAVAQLEVVASTIAKPLGIKDEGGKPVLEVLKGSLRDKQMLLVIDNFEQVVEAAPQIAELLGAAERLKILVTSRSVLRLKAEVEFSVPPLDTPGETSMTSFEELKGNEAVLLFTERARAAKPSFSLTPENAPAVAEICARLEGLPLAIELAAARIRILSPSAILTKLENRLNLLTSGSRDLPERQQTMRGAVAWSYDLLIESEKSLFRRLSVFVGGFRLEAAEDFTGGEIERLDGTSGVENRTPLLSGGSQTMEVLDGITSLIDKSLLLQKECPDGEPRFRMLEVVRDFALESLESASEADVICRRHAEYFVSYGEHAEPFLQAAQSAEWLDRLEDEHDNLRATMRWSLENDAPLAVRLAVALRNFWLVHCHLTEGYGWLKAALEKGGDPPPALRFKLLNGLGLAARFRGEYETARKAYEDGLAAGKEAGDKQGIALSSRGLGLVAMQQEDFVAAKRYFDDGLAISRELDQKFGIAISLSFLGDLARTEDRNAEARPLFEEAVELFRTLDNKSALSDALNNLGAAAFGQGDYVAAKSRFAEGLEIANDLGNKITISCSLDGFAALAVEARDFERAAQLAGAAEHLREMIGYKIEPAERRFRENYLAKLRAEMPEDSFLKLSEPGRVDLGYEDLIR